MQQKYDIDNKKKLFNNPIENISILTLNMNLNNDNRYINNSAKLILLKQQHFIKEMKTIPFH